MADILKYRLPDGTQTQVIENTKTVNLPFTTASLDFSVILDDLAVEPDEVRGWFAEQPVLTSAQRSEEYGLTVSLNQGETKTVVIKTVDAKSVGDLVSGRFNNFRDTFTITVIRASAPTVQDSDSSSPTFLTYPDSSATLTIINSSFTIQDSSVVFGVVDSNYIAARQRRDFSYLTNTPTTLDSYGITQFDSDFDSALATKTTDNLTEGNNQYFTQSRARQSISATDAGGAGSLSYNNSTGVIAYTGPSDSEIRSKLSASNDLTYNPNTGVFSIDVEVKYTKTNFDSDLGDANTGQLPEGSNLYFTNARARASVSADKGLVYSDGTGVFNIDSSHIINKVIYPNTIDSTRTIALIDSAYIQARDRFRDSAFVLATADSAHVQSKIPHAYVQALQIQYNTNDFTDSAFVNSRPISTFTNDAKYLDSTTGQNLINTAYIQSKQIQYNTSDFPDSAFVTGLPVSTFTNDKNYLDSTYAAALIDSAHIKAVVDSDYVQLIQADLQRDSGFISSVITGSTLNMGANNIITTGKVLFANVYSQLSDLPNASTYHGMFAHVHSTGKGYFAHAGAWVELANNSQLSNSGNWNTAFGWGDHASAGYQSAATALDSAMVYRFTIDSARTLQLVDSNVVLSKLYPNSFGRDSAVKLYYNDVKKFETTDSGAKITGDLTLQTTSATIRLGSLILQDSGGQLRIADSAGITTTVIRNVLDSALITQLIDAPYVQSRQTSYNTSNFTDSAFVTGLPISTFTNDTNYLDSTTVTDVINTAYVRARQALIDSDLTKQLIDSAYINARVSTVDSAAVQAIIDSSYLEVIIDSDYVTARAGVVLDSASIASGVILTTVDAAYVQSRQIQYNTSDFTDSAFVTGLPVSTFTNDVQYLDSTTVQGVISASYIQSNQNDYLDSTLTSQLIDSAYIALRTTTGTDSSTVINLIDSDYISNRVVAFANPIFTEFKYITDSAGQIVFEGNDANGNALSIETGNHSVFVNGIRLLPSDFTADVTNNRITLDSTGAAADEIVISTIKGKNALAGIGIIDSDYISSRTIAVANPQFNNFRYIATSNQTAFTGADVNSKALNITPSNFQVFLNGIRLLDSDFTADTDNNTITLSSGATASDELVITTVIGQTAVAGIAAVDSAYVQARVAAGTDSSTVISLINDTVTAAYISNHALDSAAALQILLDSSEIVALIDSAYVNARVSTVDSAQVLAIVDSDYIQTAVPSSIDSALAIQLIDSDYIGARMTGVVAPTFTNFTYIADSGDTAFSGADRNGKTLYLRTGNHSVFLNGIKLLDSDFTSNIATDTITFQGFTAADSDEVLIQTITGDIVTTGTAIDSGYVQARQEGVNATFKDYKFVATANQTVFSGNDASGTALSFEANKFHVLLNGIRLDASDFTESAANNKITLATGAAVSDELIVSTIGTEKTTTLASITSTVDSAYVQARQVDLQRDSAFVTGIIDSAYVEPLLTPIHISGSSVGIGTGSPRMPLTIAGDNSTSVGIGIDNASGTSTLDFVCLGSGYNAHGAAAGEVWWYSPDNINIGGATGNSNDIKFLGAGSERMRILSGGGITFNGNTAQANALDYYEEGTWTPSFVGATNQGTFYNRVGRYTRIGRLVVLQFFYQVAGTLPTFSNNASQFLISGIPFTVYGSGYTGSQGSVNAQNFRYTSTYNNQGMGADYLSASVNSSEQLQFYTTNSGQTRGIVNNLAASSTAWIVEATVSYFTDA